MHPEDRLKSEQGHSRLMLVILGMVQVLAALTVLRSFAVFVWLANFVYTLVVVISF